MTLSLVKLTRLIEGCASRELIVALNPVGDAGTTAGRDKKRMADIRHVTDLFAVAPQVEAGDFAAIAALGYGTVINNRPDSEAPGQLSSVDAEAAAVAAGLVYVHAPFTGSPTEAAIARLSAALDGDTGPVLAYCRSGTRSISAWALVEAESGRLDTNAIVEKAHAAGYDLSPMRGLLRSRSVKA